MMRRLAGVLVALLVAVLVLPAGAFATAATRVSFTQVEAQLMCVVCHESLALADSPEAFQERGVVRSLVLQGKTEREIDNEMVAQYGPAVLAKPPAHGFNLLVYVVPPLALIVGIVTVAVTLPRWRRRAREAAIAAAVAPQPAGPSLSVADARRLAEDLARDA
jgi:cytochrome c-type biogenesis protein CcmH